MRTIASNVMSAYGTSPRVVGTRLTFREKRLVFTGRDLSDSLGLGDPTTIDTCTYSTGVARVVNYLGTLYVAEVPDVTQLNFWPSWVSKSITLKSGSRPGIEGGYVWYQKSNGDVCYRSLASWGTENVVTSALAAYTVALAPLGTTCYAQYLDGDWLAISYLSGTSCTTWGGRIYGDIETANFIDAVTLSGKDYIYVMDRNAGRILELTRVGSYWGGTRTVIPVDDIDNISGITLASATVINSQVFLTARLVRTSDDTPVSFDVFSMGPNIFSMGKDMFLTSESVGGKLFLIGTNVYYAGANSVYTAPATMLVGYDNSAKKTVTSRVNKITFNEAENQGSALSAETAHDLDIVKGSDVDFEISYGGNYAKISTLNVQTTATMKDENGEGRTFYAMASGIRTASEWTPDASLWLPSQAKMSCHPGTLDKVVRAAGTYNVTGGPLVLEDLNTVGVLYSVARASRGGLMRAKFLYPTDALLAPRYGVISNYYRESQYDASVRLAIPQEDVNETQYGNNGIVALWSPTEYNGAPGIGLYLWTNNVMTELGCASLSVPADTWHWLQITFIEGVIKVSYRLNSSATWTDVITTTYTSATRLPWARETLGRGGIYMENVTTNSASYGFYADDLIIPVLYNTAFPTSGTVKVDEEQITINGKSNAYAEVNDLVVGEAEFNREDDAGVYTGYEVILETADGVHADDYYNGMALVVDDGSGSGKAFRISDYDAVAPRKWVPTGVYTPPDTWQDHIGDVGYGSWQASNMRRVFVTTDPSGIVGVGTNMNIVKCLYVAARGANSTQATSHSAGIVSMYTTGSSKVDWTDCYSLDRDNSVEDGVREVAYRSGTYASFGRMINNPVISGAWDSEMVTDAHNPIFDFTMPSLSIEQSVGVIFRASAIATGARANGPDVVSGYMVTINNTSGNYFLNLSKSTASVWTIAETVPLASAPQGNIRVSVQDGAFSVWCENVLLHTFYEGTYADDENSGFVASYASTITGYLPELHDFVEDVIIDNRSTGLATIEKIIDSRMVLYSSEVNGGLRFYRDRYDTGTQTIFGFSHAVESNDPPYTRLRSEGLKTVETANFTLMGVYGNVFSITPVPYAARISDFRRAAVKMTAEAASRATTHTFEIIPNPRFEIGDLIHITPDATELDIRLIAITISMAIEDSALDFVEVIQGVENYLDQI